MTVFRAYDIRGIYPSELDEDLAEKIAKAFGTFLPEGATVAVGGDVRVSTPALKERVIAALLSTGANVIDVGMVATPMVYYYVSSQGLDGGIVVTASHSPKEYNGIKLVGKGGVCLSWETGISQIKEIAEGDEFREGDGGLEQRGIEDAFIRHALGHVTVDGRKKVVIDAANGACSLVAPKLFARLGWEVVPLFCTPDGRFPNHEADPIKKKNLAHLQQRVRETKADLGVSYDADGDRLGVVNDRGEIVENNVIFSLFAQEALRKRPGAAVVYEVVVSKAVEDTIIRCGGRAVLSRVGHSYIQSALIQQKAALAGENSGHYYFPENYGYDDALFASLKVAELLNAGPLSARQREIATYLTSEEFRPPCPDQRKFTVVADLQQRLAAAGYQVNTLDGARVILERGWFIIRASNTGPQLVVRWEAQDQAAFAEIGRLVEETLAGAGVPLHGA
ncbi:MAG: phosphomannomutase/phosphoglucomutase [Candidatus Aenigmarchaeota archaeon]|nr:phosphomannomutase/phosphoglucomutase [Candidatus Aenigmarchaeota archaeon]